MPFLQIENQLESIKATAFARIAPAIIMICAIVIALADLTIAIVDAGKAAAQDCRVLLGKPTPVAHTIASVATVTLTCRECIAAFKALGISRRSGGRLLNTAEMNQVLHSA